jgi:hypothetical protein
MSKKEEEQPSIITSIKTFFHFAVGNKKKIDHEGIATNLTNEIVEILSDEEINVTPKEIIDECFIWLDNTLQPLASTMAYLVKNIIITVTIPFSLLFNDVTTVIMAIKQIQSLFFELKNFKIKNIIIKNNKPEANFLTPYIPHSQAELANINKKLDELNLIRIEIKNGIIKIVDLIIGQLTAKEIEEKEKNPEIAKKISEFILELKSSKEEQSNRVAINVFTTFVNVIFGYKSVDKKRGAKGGAIRHSNCNVFLGQRRTRTRGRQLRTKTRGRQHRSKTRRRHAFLHP